VGVSPRVAHRPLSRGPVRDGRADRGRLGSRLLTVLLTCNNAKVGRRPRSTGRSSCLERAPDERELQRQSDPVLDLGGEHVAVLGVDGHLKVRRPDRDEQSGCGDPGPAGSTPQACRTGQLGHAARVHQGGLRRKESGHDRGERRGVHEVDHAADAECRRYEPRRPLAPPNCRALCPRVGIDVQINDP
jgi:hypothetical protein